MSKAIVVACSAASRVPSLRSALRALDPACAQVEAAVGPFDDHNPHREDQTGRQLTTCSSTVTAPRSSRAMARKVVGGFQNCT